jgi:hypothetical protein
MLIRCESCGKPKAKVLPEYFDHPRLPVGFPSNGVECGTKECHKPGLAWLKTDEEEGVSKRQRVFDLPSNALEVRVA